MLQPRKVSCSWGISKGKRCKITLTNLKFHEVWLRYIDNILMVWTHGEETLVEFLKYRNNIHPIIKFTSERSTTSISLLDVNIQLRDGKIETYLYR